MTGPFNEFEKRKQDHIRIALENQSQFASINDFDQIKIRHCALPETNFSEIDISTNLLGHSFKSIHFISSMTAGHQHAADINLKLAVAAQIMGWPMAVGSQRRELTDPTNSKEWDKIRKVAPQTKFISNIGILELIESTPEKIIELMRPLDSIGLIVHINPLQEVFQNAEKANFNGGLDSIERLVKKANRPIIVKEVGSGIDSETAKKLFDCGVKIVDVAGHGGTHWGYIEAARNSKNSQRSAFDTTTFEGFENWGLSAVASLWQSQKLVDKNEFWASGGIRNGVHSAKCLALGAKAVGVAQPLMKAVIEHDLDVLQVMKTFDDQLKLAIFCAGVRKWNELRDERVWQCLQKN